MEVLIEVRESPPEKQKQCEQALTRRLTVSACLVFGPISRACVEGLHGM